MKINKILTFLLFGLILVILIELGIIFIGGSSSIQVSFPPTISPGQTSNLQPPTSNSSLPSDFKILYQDPNDKEGRTIIYESKNHKYSGVGEFYDHSTSPARLTHIIGVFERWEEIPGSKDKYLILSDPINKKTLKKTRVAFEDSILFDNGMNATALAVEDLTTKMIDNPKRQIKTLEEIIDTLIKKDDIVIILPLFRKNGAVVLDDKQTLAAGWLILRRLNGSKMMIKL